MQRYVQQSPVYGGSVVTPSGHRFYPNTQARGSYTRLEHTSPSRVTQVRSPARAQPRATPLVSSRVVRAEASPVQYSPYTSQVVEAQPVYQQVRTTEPVLVENVSDPILETHLVESPQRQPRTDVQEDVQEPVQREVQQGDQQLEEAAPELLQTVTRWFRGEITEISGESLLEPPAQDLYSNHEDWRQRLIEDGESQKVLVSEACQAFLERITEVVEQHKGQLIEKIDEGIQRRQETLDSWLQDVDYFTDKSRGILLDERARLREHTVTQSTINGVVNEQSQIADRPAEYSDMHRATGILMGVREGAKLQQNAEHIIEGIESGAQFVDTEALGKMWEGVSLSPEPETDGVVDVDAGAIERERVLDLVPVSRIVQQRTTTPVQQVYHAPPVQQQQIIRTSYSPGSQIHYSSPVRYTTSSRII